MKTKDNFIALMLLTSLIYVLWASQVVRVVKNPPTNAGAIREAGWILRSGRTLEEGMVTHSNILAWRIHGLSRLAGFGP